MNPHLSSSVRGFLPRSEACAVTQHLLFGWMLSCHHLEFLNNFEQGASILMWQWALGTMQTVLLGPMQVWILWEPPDRSASAGTKAVALLVR